MSYSLPLIITCGDIPTTQIMTLNIDPTFTYPQFIGSLLDHLTQNHFWRSVLAPIERSRHVLGVDFLFYLSPPGFALSDMDYIATFCDKVGHVLVDCRRREPWGISSWWMSCRHLTLPHCSWSLDVTGAHPGQ